MVTVRNTSSRLVTLRLNSGQALILPPLATAEKIMIQEVERNAKVQKLLDLGVISIPELERQSEEGHEKGEGSRKTAPHKRKTGQKK